MPYPILFPAVPPDCSGCDPDCRCEEAAAAAYAERLAAVRRQRATLHARRAQRAALLASFRP